MDASTIVNIILCVLSFLLAAISVITVVITLRQNHKMIENSTRPYVAIYCEHTRVSLDAYYICIKNFGQSGATIRSLSCSQDLGEIALVDGNVPFANLSDTVIAPGQSFICPIDYKKARQKSPLIFEINYVSDCKWYRESYTLNLNVYTDLLTFRADGNDSVKTIASTLENILEKSL